MNQHIPKKVDILFLDGYCHICVNGCKGYGSNLRTQKIPNMGGVYSTSPNPDPPWSPRAAGISNPLWQFVELELNFHMLYTVHQEKSVGR